MKNFLTGCLCLFSASCLAGQTPIPVPDTLSGTDFHLYMRDSSHVFFPGYFTATRAYNGSYLGPTIVVNAGDSVNFFLHNETSDTTTAHWHGLHVAPEDDGGPHQIILPGNTWSPGFTVRNRAATYWYHPHPHQMTMDQVLRGAAGLIIVRDTQEAALNLPRTYGLDDIPLVFQFQTFDNTTRQIVLDDEFDNTILVNGTVNGLAEAPAQVVRLRLLNGSSHRFFRFGFNDGRTFYQIASDNGLLDAPVPLTRLTLGTGERAEILVDLSGLAGDTLLLRTYGNELPTGYPGGPPGMGMSAGPLDNIASDVLHIAVVPATAGAITSIPSALTTNIIWSSAGASARTITMTASPMMSTNFFLNGVQFDENVINFTVNKGVTEIWTLNNNTMMAHPFHIHGNHFYVLEVEGAAPPLNERGPRDVVIVPPMMGSVKLITRYEDFSDSLMPYMYHCHILSHEDNGMMGQFLVYDPPPVNLASPLSSGGIEVFPNPAGGKDLIRIRSDETISGIRLMNMQGMDVYRNEQVNRRETELNPDVAPGVYLLEIFTGQGLTRFRILRN